jgi:hypothetical protein
LNSGNADTAFSNYRSAQETFDAVFTRVSKKREQATEAMRQATLRAQEAENFALEAATIEVSEEE